MTSETTPEMSLKFGRRLNLDVADDRDLLLTSSRDDPELSQLIELNLSDYLAWFRAPEWRTVSGGGMISDPANHGRNIRRMLEITADLRELSTIDGSQAFLQSLTNPTQISATLLEIDVAKWLTQRFANRSLMVGPTINRGGRIKRPDFRWTTDIGTCYVECKQMVNNDSDAHRRASRIADWVDEEVSDIELHSSVRLEVGVNFVVNGLESNLRACLRSNRRVLESGQPRTLIDTDVFSIKTVPREEIISRPGVVGIGRMTVTDNPVQVGDAIATHTYVYVDVRRARAKVIKRLTSEARSQLPLRTPAILIFDAHGVEVEERCTQLVDRSAAEDVRMICLWGYGEPRWITWRDEQEFTAAIFAPIDLQDQSGNPWNPTLP